MNTLSWLLYGAELAANMKMVLGFGAIGGLIAIPAAWVVAAWVHDFHTEEEEVLTRIRRKWVVGARVAPICALLWAATPSHNTIMLIAASQVGEQIVSTQQAQELGGEAGQLAVDSLRVLRKFINEQLGEAAE